MKNSLVSIIVPIFNAEDYLENCVNSILSQTYTNIEILLINDGSTDNSRLICESFSKKDPRVKVFNQSNQGPSEARNKGIQYANGEYLQFVDADDCIDRHMTQRLISSLQNDEDLVICGYQKVIGTNQSNIKKKFQPLNEGSYTVEEFIELFPELFRGKLINSPCNKLYKKEIICDNQITFDKTISNGEDLLFNLKYFTYSRKISIIKDLLYTYININNSFSLTNRYKKNYLENRKFIFKKINDFLEDISLRTKKDSLLEEIFNDYLLQIINNVFNINVILNNRNIIVELKEILNDEWIINNLDKFREDSLEKKAIKKLLKIKSYKGIFLYFGFKNPIKKVLRPIYYFLLKTLSNN